jgi:hypothetical protein
MTDIDALIRQLELDAEDRGYFMPDQCRPIITALTTERAKVAALEADVKFWQERHDHIQDRRKIDDAALQDLFCRAHVAAGYPADDEDQSNDAHIGRLFIRHRYAFAKAVADQAESARWREVAGELAGAMQKAEPHLDAIICYASTMDEHEPNRIAHDFRAALTRFKQESDHDA